MFFPDIKSQDTKVPVAEPLHMIQRQQLDFVWVKTISQLSSVTQVPVLTQSENHKVY